MIDKILVLIYVTCHYFKKPWYNQEPNYSINIFIIKILKLKIFDYKFKFVDS